MNPQSSGFESRLFYEERRYETDLSGPILDMYLEHGWYPMQQSVFTITHHAFSRFGDLYKAWWLRYNVGTLRPHRSHKELRRKNRHVEVEFRFPYEHLPELYELYLTYYKGIDFQGYETISSATFDMGQPNVFDTGALLLKEGGKTFACGIFHYGADSAASVLHFHDHRHDRLSPGRYLMLLTTDWMRETSRTWYYPGYLLAGLPKFDYKLFLGRDQAQVFNPRSFAQTDVGYPLEEANNPWDPFRESFRETPVLQVLDVLKAYLNRKITPDGPQAR